MVAEDSRPLGDECSRHFTGIGVIHLDKSDTGVLISVAMLSRSAEYAVRALSLLALREGDSALHSAEIADELDLPPQFLSKILRRLKSTGLVTSQRGRAGGFRLNRSADEIPLLAVVQPFQDGLSGVECLLGQADCTDSDTCPLHDRLTGIRQSFHDLLAGTTLADIAQRAIRTGTTISISTQERETDG
jgi:Rrf2 family protein